MFQIRFNQFTGHVLGDFHGFSHRAPLSQQTLSRTLIRYFTNLISRDFST